MEHHESMRPIDSDESTVVDVFLDCRYKGEALDRPTHSVDTSSSALGEGPKEGVPWRSVG